jgi:hypothetical protein
MTGSPDIWAQEPPADEDPVSIAGPTTRVTDAGLSPDRRYSTRSAR